MSQAPVPMDAISEAPRAQMKRQVYKCRCGNVSTQENYMPDETPLPCLPCGKCKAGQGMDMQTQWHKQVGLLTSGQSELYTI
jgi:hypothetical protein